MRRDEDGSLTIVIQPEPTADTNNWLPAPAEPFRLSCAWTSRGPPCSWAGVLDGSYKIPPITKAPR